ncbi:MAG: hypothetical protein KUG77_29345 [Nannocystaceae bacterium]|nr:hypothetical protein [Nannocystaceae bacterium]
MDVVRAPLLRTTLERHPRVDHATISSVRAELFHDGDALSVAFAFSGALEHLVLPEASLDPAKLWEHTCAELFVASEDGHYVEWNFSPTGQTTRFEFSEYRVRRSASFDQDVETSVTRDEHALRLAAKGPLLRGIERIASASLSAVIRAPGGACSYWALKHPAGAPDFHDFRGFTIDGRLFRGCHAAADQ